MRRRSAGKELRAAAADVAALRLEIARRDFACFVEHCYLDEHGRPLRLTPMHLRWAELAAREPRLAIRAFCESGKTTILGRALPVWLLGRNPEKEQILIVSNTHHQASRLLKAIEADIQANQRVKAVFPTLRAGDAITSTALNVEGKEPSPSFSVEASGLSSGNPLLGTRATTVILDDLDDRQSASTPLQRRNMLEQVLQTVLTRVVEAGRVLAVGTTWHSQDCIATLSKRPGWLTLTCPLVNEDGSSAWPERFSPARIERIRGELGSAMFATMYLCDPTQAEDQPFKQEYIDLCLEAGRKLKAPRSLAPADVPEGAVVVTGVDLAASRADGADLSALFTIMRWASGDYLVLECCAGKWSPGEVVREIVAAHRRWNSLVVVEINSGFSAIAEWVKESDPDVPVRTWTTNAQNKWDPQFGFTSLAAEMERAAWYIPGAGGVDPEVEAWLEELRDWRPGRHSGDRAMASWIAREGARVYCPQRPGGGEVHVTAFVGRQPNTPPGTPTRPKKQGTPGWRRDAEVDMGLDPAIFDDDDSRDGQDDVDPVGSVVQVDPTW